MTRNSRNCIELGGDNLLEDLLDVLRKTAGDISRFCDDIDDGFWKAMKEARLAEMLAIKYIKIERRRLKELTKLILSMVTYIMAAYIRLIRGYRRASGWRITGEE